MSEPQRTPLGVVHTLLFLTAYLAFVLWLLLLWGSIEGIKGGPEGTFAMLAGWYTYLFTEGNWFAGLLSFLGFFAVAYIIMQLLVRTGVVKLSPFSEIRASRRWMAILPVILVSYAIVQSSTGLEKFVEPAAPEVRENAGDLFNTGVVWALCVVIAAGAVAFGYFRNKAKREARRRREDARAKFAEHLPRIEPSLAVLLDRLLGNPSNRALDESFVREFVKELRNWAGPTPDSMSDREVVEHHLIDRAGLPARLVGELSDALRLADESLVSTKSLVHTDAVNAVSSALTLVRSLIKINNRLAAGQSPLDRSSISGHSDAK